MSIIGPEERIRALREAHGISLRELARRTGKDKGHWSRIERGERPLSLPMLVALAQALGLRELVKALRPFVGHDPEPTARHGHAPGARGQEAEPDV